MKQKVVFGTRKKLRKNFGDVCPAALSLAESYQKKKFPCMGNRVHVPSRCVRRVHTMQWKIRFKLSWFWGADSIHCRVAWTWKWYSALLPACTIFIRKRLFKFESRIKVHMLWSRDKATVHASMQELIAFPSQVQLDFIKNNWLARRHSEDHEEIWK